MFVASLHRYPVKGLSPEELPSVELKSSQGFPLDRAFAITDGSFQFDPKNPVAQPKTKFLVLAKYERLANLKTKYSSESGRLEIAYKGLARVYDLSRKSDRVDVALFTKNFLDVTLPGEPELINAPGHQFTDVSVHSASLMRSISLINLATVRDLQQRVGVFLDPLRFRANLYFDDAPASSELEWLGREITIGTVKLRIARRTKRCPATSVNPETGERNINVPIAIREYVQHGDLGVYAEVLEGGTLTPRDSMHLEAQTVSPGGP
ncbi:MOSC domain protein [Caballeronia pedi]|uniref:MOSC domain protein n=1 Tax=Caballeronia pedi TaxID=1777141 RepID=A0A158D2X2_9BURK|nr:MOSC domain-containing protein [Caballeronia pedi]SAK88962.1 MOSC domain protein [Caballeronia pedi]